MNKLSIILACCILFISKSVVYADESKNIKSSYIFVGGKNNTSLTPYPNDEGTQKIVKRTDLELQASRLARHGFYEEALSKYREAINPSLLNNEYDKATALGGIEDIYERQRKFDLALKIHQWFMKANPEKDYYIDKQLELEALIKARDSRSNETIYGHIAYLRRRYGKFIPPQSQGDSGFHSTPIEQIIRLYDWMGDSDGGIKFMNEVLSSKSIYPAEHKEYEKVKAAFEEDKRTGQKGHLQKVIETSNIIGW